MRVKPKIFACLAVIGFCCFAYYCTSSDSSSIDHIISIAGLPQIPKTATIIHVDTSGGMFSRQYYLQFMAPQNDIDAWLSMKSEFMSSSNTECHIDFSHVSESELYTRPEAFSSGNAAPFPQKIPHQPQWYNDLRILHGKKYVSSKSPAWHILLYIQDNAVTIYVSWS